MTTLAIIATLTAESTVKKREDGMLVFMVDVKADRHQAEQAVKKLCDSDVPKVSTLIGTDGEEGVYVQLAPDCDALDVTNKLESSKLSPLVRSKYMFCSSNYQKAGEFTCVHSQAAKSVLGLVSSELKPTDYQLQSCFCFFKLKL